MAPIKDLTGLQFGRLKVLGLSTKRQNGHLVWICACECGQLTQVTAVHLKHGDTKSCGCLCREMALAKRPAATEASKAKLRTHGHSPCSGRSPEYRAWSNMISRCTNPRVNSYKYYGARGISVCERWRIFCNFFADMGYKPSSMSLDRIDTNGNYEPSNCRWATAKEQAASKRRESWSKNTSEAIKKHWITRRARALGTHPERSAGEHKNKRLLDQI